MNIGAKGVRSTVGVSGTGLSYSTYSSHSGTTNMATGQSKSGASSSGLGCLVIGGIIVGAIILIKVLIEAGAGTGISFLVGIVGTGCGIGAYLSARETKATRARAEANARAVAEEQAAAAQRFGRLSAQYGEENAQKILAGNVWMGCTVDMMVEILGQPVATDEKVMKTKISRTYKYHPTGVNRYALRIYVEDGEVVGWEDKTD